MVFYLKNSRLVVTFLAATFALPSFAQIQQESIKDRAIKQLNHEMRLIRSGSKAALKLAKREQLTEKERQDLKDFSKRVGAAIGLLAVVGGITTAAVIIDKKRKKAAALLPPVPVPAVPVVQLPVPPAPPAKKDIVFNKKRSKPLETKEEYQKRKELERQQWQAAEQDRIRELGKNPVERFAEKSRQEAQKRPQFQPLVQSEGAPPLPWRPALPQAAQDLADDEIVKQAEDTFRQAKELANRNKANQLIENLQESDLGKSIIISEPFQQNVPQHLLQSPTNEQKEAFLKMFMESINNPPVLIMKF